MEKYNVRKLEGEELKEYIKMRPFMFIGRDLYSVYKELILGCITTCESDKIMVIVTVIKENDFEMEFSSQQNLFDFIELFKNDIIDGKTFMPFVIKAISKKFKLTLNDSKFKIRFSFIEKMINDKFDYLKLFESLKEVALLNRNCEIILKDRRFKYLNQNYFHFPEGIFYLFEKAKNEALGKPKFNLIIDETINENRYQIGLAYRTDWYPEMNIISYANDICTINRGSLVEGIFLGLLHACKIYKRKNKLKNYKVNIKKLFNGLILVCSVRGKEFQYGGSFKESLDEESICKEIQSVFAKKVLDYFESDKENAADFLWRFDTNQFASNMY